MRRRGRITFVSNVKKLTKLANCVQRWKSTADSFFFPQRRGHNFLKWCKREASAGSNVNNIVETVLGFPVLKNKLTTMELWDMKYAENKHSAGLWKTKLIKGGHWLCGHWSGTSSVILLLFLYCQKWQLLANCHVSMNSMFIPLCSTSPMYPSFLSNHWLLTDPWNHAHIFTRKMGFVLHVICCHVHFCSSPNELLN